jgi:hypothetical protein
MTSLFYRLELHGFSTERFAPSPTTVKCPIIKGRVLYYKIASWLVSREASKRESRFFLGSTKQQKAVSFQFFFSKKVRA